MKNFKFVGISFTFLFWFFSISASAFTLADGDTITIKSGTYYLSSDATAQSAIVDNNVITPSESCLWRVAITGTNEFNLFNVQTGWALAWFSNDNLGIYSPADTWSVYNTNYLRSVGTVRYVRCVNGAWSSNTRSNRATVLTVNKFSSATVTTTTDRSFSLSPTSKECDKWYCGQDFTPVSTITTSTVTTYTEIGVPSNNFSTTPIIATTNITTPVTYTLSGDAAFTLNAHSYDRNATVTAQANSSYNYRNGLLSATITFPDGTVHSAEATIRQEPTLFTYTSKTSQMSFTPTYYEFPQTAAQYNYFSLAATTYTTTYTAYLNGADTVVVSQVQSTDTYPTITNLTYALSGNSGFAKNNEARAGLNIYTTSANTGSTLLTATLTATGVIDGVTYKATAQCVQIAGFLHQKGASNRSFQANGMQGVHTLEEVIYVKAGTSRRLELPVPSDGGSSKQYYRWYNYDTDSDVGAALTHTTTYNYLQSQIGAYGDFMIHGGNPGITTYAMPATPVNKKVAVDISRNKDHITGSTFTEPTLSYRVIYDIRNAQEIATALSTCTGSTFLEEYNIVAPTGATISIGPKYRYTGGAATTNYFVNPANPAIITTPVWKRGTATISPTVIDNRLIQPAVVNTPQTVVYTLTANGVNIAKFTVVYKDVAKVGPVKETAGKAIITNVDLDKRYTLVEKRSFDYTDGGTDIYYPNPLPWNEGTYGFNYHNSIRYDGITTDWGEYNLMRTTTGSDMTGWLYTGIDNRGGKDNGYFFYVDASEKPGKIADLKINGRLCPGTSIYFSAWVADLANANSAANLNFVISGIRGNVEENISMFTTGVMKIRGSWTQVFFDLQLNEQEYDEYRLRIVNNGESSSGNDFAIDDIRIYVSNPPTSSFQAIMACGAKEDEIVAVLRADYDNPSYAWSVSGGDATFYYQWQASDNTILNLNYLNGNANLYGQLNLQNGLTIAQIATKYGSSYVYSSLQEYLGTAANENKTVDFFFVNESVMDPETGIISSRPILYIINRSAVFQLGFEYKSVLVVGAPVFDLDCGNVSSFVVQPRSQLTLNDQLQRGGVVSTLCAGQSYEVSIRVFDSQNESMSVIQGYCYSDFYRGDPTNLDQLTTALWAFRSVYKTATTFNQPVTGVYTTAYKNLLTAESTKFDLYKRKVAIGIPTDGKPIIFIVWPILGTGVISEGSGDLVVCNEPVRIVLTAAASLTFGPEILPEALIGAPTVVRLSEYDANHTFSVPVRTKDGEVTISEIKLYASTDPTYNSNVTIFNLTPSNIQPNVGESISVTPKAGNTPGFTLKGGYSYDFYAPLEGLSGDECAVKAAYFKVNVVPEVVIWQPLTGNRSWNNDANWATIDGVGQGFVPLSHTNVIIENASSSPALPTSPDAHTTEVGSQAYITYDLNYKKWDCENVYFKPGAMLLNQQKLNYDKAWVDMKMETNHWELLSAPMTGIVSGDMYIPKNGDTTQPFQNLLPVDNRSVHYPFWHSVYNKETYDVTVGSVVTVTSTTWTDPVNYLGNAYAPGTGFALWGEYAPNTSVNSVVVRFPKTETSYRYYSSTYDTPLTAAKYLVPITRPVDYGKLGFKPTEADGETMKVTLTNATPGRIFLIGNPLMANLDLELFFAQNPALSGTFWLYDSDIQTTIPVTPLNGLTTSTSEIHCIGPMRSFLVQTTADVTSLTVNFKASMGNIVPLGAPQGVPNPSPARARSKAVAHNSLVAGGVLHIDAERNGVKSRAIVAQNNAASRAYVMGEDADLLMLDKTMTPSAIYTIADNRALSINAVSDIDMIPLAFRVVDKSKAKHISLQFNGVNSFNETLYLYDAYTGNSTQINEGASFDLEAPLADEMRYYVRVMYISTDVETSNSVIDDVTIYNKEAGSVLVYTSATIEKLTVFNMAGQMVEQEQNLWTNIKAVNLPTGVYLFEIVTDRGVANKKVLVR